MAIKIEEVLIEGKDPEFKIYEIVDAKQADGTVVQVLDEKSAVKLTESFINNEISKLQAQIDNYNFLLTEIGKVKTPIVDGGK